MFLGLKLPSYYHYRYDKSQFCQTLFLSTWRVTKIDKNRDLECFELDSFSRKNLEILSLGKNVKTCDLACAVPSEIEQNIGV